jgi:murein DD-endopeptidase MepM/ murein hydrolase activator NlpD
MSDQRFLSIMVVPEDGRESHTFRVSYRSLRLAAAAGSVLVLGMAVLAGSWWYLAARAAKVPALEAQVAQHASDQARMESFATPLVELEARYEQIRQLFGPDAEQVASGLWLPPPAPRGASQGPDPDDGGSRPTSWPLTGRGFVTQRLLEGDAGAHPGLDIAVPADSYIRAAGAGIVVDVGDDPVYGRFVSLDHGEGYRTVYAHASSALVEVGQRVRRNEVIALSGSTGRSTAPHLHFEILHNGEPVDPLSMVRQP